MYQHEARKGMHLSPPRDHKRRTNPGNLAPVEGDEPHAESRYSPKELVDDEIVCEVKFVSRSIPKSEKGYTHSARSSTPTRKMTSR